jgi:acyl dehydratase
MADETFIKGKITDEDLVKLEQLVGYPNPTLGSGRNSDRPHYTVVTSDAIRHYTNGYGDDNPLFCDPTYGAASRWGSQIGSPTFSGGASWDRTPRVSKELHQVTRGALRGVHLFFSGSETHFYRPVVLGDTLTTVNALLRVEPKQSQFSGGRSVITHNGGATVNAQGEVVEFNRRWFVHAEREGSAAKAKERKIALASYTDEDLKVIDEAYENELVRGADTLYYEELEVGDSMPKMVKGPLTVRDIIGMHIGWGWGNYLNGALKLDYQNRKRTPGFYGKNEWGAWDCMQRLHWDPAFAQAIGNPTTYDYGNMRIAWLTHALTNFVGDDGWIHRFKCELRKFNFVGDTTWLVGEVTAKRMDPVLGPAVEVSVRCENQRGEVTATADATLLVASRETGLATLPEPPADTFAQAPEPVEHLVAG